MKSSAPSPHPRRLALPRGSLARTLLVVLLPLVVGPLVTVTVLLYFQVQNNITNQVTGQLTSLADLKENQIDQWALARVADMNSLVRSPDILQHSRDLVFEPAGSAARAAADAALTNRLEDHLNSPGNIAYKGYMLIDAETGRVLLATELYRNLVGQDLFLAEQYFRTARQAALVAPPGYDPRLDPNNLWLVAAGPVIDPNQGTIAVLIGVLIPGQLQQIVSPIPGLAASSRAYVVSGDGYEFGPIITSQTIQPASVGIQRALAEHANGNDQYADPGGLPVLGAYRWLPRLEIALLVEVDAGQAYAPLRRLTATLAIITAVAVVFAALGVIVFTRYITGPIGKLTESARRMATGDLRVAAEIRRSDEIGALSAAFNSMAGQLRELLESLEQRVEERTRIAERRTVQMTTGAEIARVASTELDPDRLLLQAVNLVRDRFDLYYVGAFVADENNKFAVLKAGTGEAGRLMLANKHRLEIGGQSMIGRAVDERKARIALDVGQEAVRFSNPVLPRTRSEMALPLIARDRAIGALTIQSDQPSAFTPEDILSLQGMADLIAVALDNARLFQEARRALDEVTAVHRSYITQAWTTFAETHREGEEKTPTYIFADNAFLHGESVALPGLDQAVIKRQPVIAADAASSTLTVPIKLRDQVIGALAVEAETPDHQWTADEMTLIEAVVEQAALSLENARLIEESESALAETRRLAAREQTVNTISSKIRRLPSVESILTTALIELGRTLGASKGQVRLGSLRRTVSSEVSDE